MTNKLKTILAFTLLLSIVSLQINKTEGQKTAVISGAVRDEENKPLVKALIGVLRSGTTEAPKYTLTDSSGNFLVTVTQEGTYLVYAMCDRPETEGVDYVPALWTTSVQFGSTSMFTFALEKGASLYFDEDLWFVESSKPGDYYRFTVMSKYGTYLVGKPSVRTYGSDTDLLRRFNFYWKLAVIPADTEVIISVYARAGTVSHTLTIKEDVGYFKLSQGETMHVDMREYGLNFNLENMKGMLNLAFYKLREAEDAGFLVTADRQDLLNSYSLVEVSALSLKKGLYDESFAELRNAYILAKGSLERLQGLIQIGSQSALLLLALFVFISSASAYLVTERESNVEILARGEKRFSFSINVLMAVIFYVLLVISFYVLFPGCHLVPQTVFIIISVLAFIIGQASVAILRYKFSERRSEQRSVQLRSAILIAFSMASRNLRRRKLRTIIGLGNMMILVFGFITITSIAPGYGLLTTSLRPALALDALLVRDRPTESSNPFMPLPSYFIAWLEKNPNITLIAPKAENMPVSSSNPLGYLYTHSGVPITVLGIMGVIPSVEARITMLNNTIVRGNYLEDDDVRGVILSSSYQERLGLDVNDKLYGFGQDFIIRGFFDPKLLAALVDVDGQPIVPYYIEPMVGPVFCSPDDVIIVLYERAFTLPKVVISRVNIQLKNIEDYSTFAQTITLSREYTVYISHPGSLYSQYIGSYLEEKGLGQIPLLMSLVVLNIAASMLGSVKERKNEIASLSSVGLNPTHIMALFMAEATVIGFVGGGLGYLLGILGYRIASMPIFGALQVREKISAEWGLLALLLSGFAAILASVIPALQASTTVTPSLLRKWRLSEKEKPKESGQPWVLDLPAKLRLRELEPFIGFIQKRLREQSVSSIERISDVNLKEEETINGPLIQLSFKWISESMGWSQNEIMISREEGKDYFDAKIICKPQRNIENPVISSVSLVRKLIFEWNALKFEVATSFDPSLSQLYTLVNAYTPTTLYIITTDLDISEKLESLRKRVEWEGFRFPRIVLSRVKPLDVNQCMKAAEEVVSKVDVVCISGGTDAVSTALALNAEKQKKMICYVIDPRPLAERMKDPFQILKIVNI